MSFMNPINPRTTAKKIDIDKTLAVRIAWADGHVSEFPIIYLRKHCPCAGCRTERREDQPAPAGAEGKRKPLLRVLQKGEEEPVAIREAKLVGRYALQIVWSDNHDTGIYSFDYLRELDDASAQGGR